MAPLIVAAIVAALRQLSLQISCRLLLQAPVCCKPVKEIRQRERTLPYQMENLVDNIC